MKIRSSTLGFTLTELILVIVLLSILSLFAASRFIGKSSFSAFALQEQVISVIRQVQVNRMQSNIDVPPKDHPERCNPSEYSSGEDSSYTNFCLSVVSSCIGSSMACDLQQKCENECRRNYWERQRQDHDPQHLIEPCAINRGCLFEIARNWVKPRLKKPSHEGRKDAKID